MLCLHFYPVTTALNIQYTPFVQLYTPTYVYNKYSMRTHRTCVLLQ